MCGVSAVHLRIPTVLFVAWCLLPELCVCSSVAVVSSFSESVVSASGRDVASQPLQKHLHNRANRRSGRRDIGKVLSLGTGD